MRPTIAPLLLAGWLSACGPGAALDALPSGGKARVVGASAGDALTLADGRTVRLAGVEAPHGDDPYAGEAQAALGALAAGREVELLQGGAVADPYGRALAHVRTGERRWLEGELLARGAVRVRTYADNRAMAPAMLEAEARARVAGRGLWALSAYRVRLPNEVGLSDRGLVVVEGRVRSASPAGRWLRIAFAEAPDGLTAEIPPGARDDLAVAGVDPAGLTGRLIRVRGAVRAFQGRPVITVDHPEQVERLDEPRRRNENARR
jgi:endonuclease YncB( thermonuclease family)